MDKLTEKINEYKKRRNAIIIAHYYQAPEIMDIADFVGDSLDLSRKARDAKADVIVTCGVYFMAETAKILSPEKTVLLPALNAGCPMADMITPEDVMRLRSENPNAAVVTYVNSSAAVKAVSDICCTSSNAVKVVESLPEKEIIFIPDKNLGNYVAGFVPDKKMIYYNGYCPVHNSLTAQDIANARKAHPGAPILMHPECRPEVVKDADFVGSTAAIIEYATKSSKNEFIISTEQGILHRLKKENPDKRFYMPKEQFICADMKKITIDDVLNSLENMEYRIELDEKIIKKAFVSLDRMLGVK